MAVPNMRRTVAGWVTRKPVKLITKELDNFQVVETEEEITLKINIQPTPKTQVDNKPEEQRSWKWWSAIVQGTTLLKIDDVIEVDGERYRVQSVSDWTRSGFTKYELVEDLMEAEE